MSAATATALRAPAGDDRDSNTALRAPADLTDPPPAPRAPFELYGRGLHSAAHGVVLREEDGTGAPLALDTWLGAPDAADEDVLARAVGPVLDVGCGPGRHVLALARRGVLALGVDACPAAVRLARGRGAAVVEGSIFGKVPGAGRWGSALLLDGNVGIGGRPAALLAHVLTLLTPGGGVLVELDAPGTRPRPSRVRLEAAGETSDWFAWARVGADAIAPLAAAAGASVSDSWCSHGRWFACLVVAAR